MKPHNLLFIILLLYSATSFAQPAWSPARRSEMEMGWLRDSLHLTPAQEAKAGPVTITYQQQMDNAHGSPKKERAAMKKKDAAMKSILTASQYKTYYRRERKIRSLPKPDRTGQHRAY